MAAAYGDEGFIAWTDDDNWDGGDILLAAADLQDNLKKKFEAISGKTWEEKLMSCINCECCPRHMINRPTELKPWIELPWSGDEEKYEMDSCVCPCRHNARFICRQVEEPPSLCPQGSLNEVDDFITVLTPVERNAWLDRLDVQEMEEAMGVLTTSES
tara:strand:- start:490 stop:963 length:474 start_codon:yes stop_codon:yes gene_type:complete